MESAKEERTKVKVEGKGREKRRNESIPISFTDYHRLWKGIATSIVNYDKHRENDCKISENMHCYVGEAQIDMLL